MFLKLKADISFGTSSLRDLVRNKLIQALHNVFSIALRKPGVIKIKRSYFFDIWKNPAGDSFAGSDKGNRPTGRINLKEEIASSPTAPRNDDITPLDIKAPSKATA